MSGHAAAEGRCRVTPAEQRPAVADLVRAADALDVARAVLCGVQ